MTRVLEAIRNVCNAYGLDVKRISAQCLELTESTCRGGYTINTYYYRIKKLNKLIRIDWDVTRNMDDQVWVFD